MKEYLLSAAVALCWVLGMGCSSPPPANPGETTPVVETTPSQIGRTPMQNPTPPESQTPASDDQTPAVGSRYMQGQTPYTVVGAGTAPFEYTATGESLELVVGDIPGTIVLVPDTGAVVKVVPSEASVTINDKAHKPVNDNTYLKKNGAGKQWVLLELIRE